MASRCGVDSGMVVVLLITAVLICLSWVSSSAFSYPYIIFVMGAMGGARVNFFCPV